MATWKEKYNKKYQYKENKSHNLSDISKDTGISRGGLQKIYNKGIGAYKTNPQSVRPTVTSKEQWAMARVYSSVMGGKASKVDAKELKMQMGGSTNDFDRTDYYKDYYERLSPSDFVVEKENQKITINMNNKYESGGETNFNPDGNIKDKVIHASGDAGGMLVGKRHSNGGIKALNKSTGQPLEMEGGEVVITRNAVSDNKKRSFNGKMLTNRQILSEINESGGGVSFADGGKVPKNVKFDCNAEYEYGGKTMCGKDLAYAMGGVTNYSKDGNDVINVFLEKSPKEKYFGDFDDLLVSGKVISKNKFNPYIKDNMVILDSDYDWLAIKKNNTVEIDFGYGSSGLIDDIQYLIQEKAIQNGLNVKVDLLKRLASNNKYYIKNGLIALNPNYALGGEIDLFEQYDKQPKELSEIVQMYEERYLDGDMDYKDSQKFLKEVNAIGYTFDLGLDNEPYNLRPMMAKGGTIKCGSCDWSWDRKDGGDDMYVCHKCGTDNTNKYKKGGITVKNNRMKKNIMKFAKEIRKKDEKWQDALKRAKIEMNKSSSKKSSNIDSELGKLKKLMKEDEILKEYNYSKKNTRKSNKSLQNGGDVMSLGIANADAVFEKGGEIEEYIVIHTSMKPESFIKKHKLSNYEYEIDESDYDGFSRINFETYPKNQNFIKDKSIKEFYYEPYEEYAKGGYIPYADVREFEVYVNEFYGKNGIYKKDYDGGFTRKEIIEAVSDYIKDPKTEWGGGDSVDRELMRDRYLIPSRYPNRKTEYKEKGGKIKKSYAKGGEIMFGSKWIKKGGSPKTIYNIDNIDGDRIYFHSSRGTHYQRTRENFLKEYSKKGGSTYAKGGKLSKDDGGRFSNYKDSVKLYYNDDRYSFTKGISTKHDKFLLVSENRLDKLKSEDNYSDGFWQYPNKDISPVPILVLQKNEWSKDLYAVPLRNYEAKDSMESGGNYVGNYMLGAISLFDRRNLSGRDADDISSYAQGTPRYAKGGEIETNREFIEVVNQVKEENEALPNDFVNVMDSINAILQDRGYDEHDEYTYDVRQDILDRYEKKVLDKKGLRFAKGGEVLVDSKNINDIHKKYKNVSQLDVVGSPNGQNYAIIDGQNFNIFIDDKLKVSNNRVVGIKKPSFITGKMAKGGKLSKDDAITKALELGVDFKKDFHSQSFGNELSQLAKDTGYRKSKSSSGSLGRSFFNHLEKIYDKNSSYYDSTLKPKSYADGGDIGEYPRVYIADLEAYNSGKLQGEWLDLEDYNDSEEFNDAVQDLLDGWGVEEYAIHDVENFPSGMYSEYMSTSDFDEIFDMIELAKDNNLPIDVVMEVVSQYDESAVDEYQGQYEDGEDFAYQLIEDIGLESFSDPQYFTDITDTDRRLLAQEMADSYTEDIAYEDDGERVVEEAGLDVDEYRELDGEDDDKRDEILEEAKEIVRDEYYETWYDGLDDPYDFLVNEQGLYSDEDFFKANFIQIDYGELANALEQDYLFIENDKGLFVFNVR